jgi:hypothetical protein
VVQKGAEGKGERKVHSHIISLRNCNDSS